jgi:hypothetical protein
MIAILCPNDKMYDTFYDLALKESSPTTYVTSNFEQVRAMVRLGEVDKVVIIMGALNCSSYHNKHGVIGGQVNSKVAYDTLKKEKEDLKVVVIDGYDWKIPGQLLLCGSGENWEDVLKTALSA